MGGLDVDVEVFERRLFEAGKQLEHAVSSGNGLLQSLEKVELCLSVVKQLHSRPMPPSLCHAILPSMDTLINPDLLRHRDKDVRLLVLNCLCQIARITAPNEPYDEDVLKEILELIVESFQDLGEMNSTSFARTIFILKIVEEVNLCTVMVDLELNNILLEMFKHFFAAVSQHTYSTDVYDSMKKIMCLVLDQSDDISQKLLSVLLINLRREMRDSSPAAHALAIGVVASCAEKLRPYLKAIFPSSQAISCNCIHGYHEIIYDIYRHGSQEKNASQYTGPTEEVVLTENCTKETVTSSLTENSQVASSQLYPDDHHNEKKHDMEKSEADPRLLRLFSHIPTFPFPFPDTCERRRGRSKKPSYGKEEDSRSIASAETGFSGTVAVPDYTAWESGNNVSGSKSLKRKKTPGRNSAKNKGIQKKVDF